MLKIKITLVTLLGLLMVASSSFATQEFIVLKQDDGKQVVTPLRVDIFGIGKKTFFAKPQLNFNDSDDNIYQLVFNSEAERDETVDLILHHASEYLAIDITNCNKQREVINTYLYTDRVSDEICTQEDFIEIPYCKPNQAKIVAFFSGDEIEKMNHTAHVNPWKHGSNVKFCKSSHIGSRI